MIYKGYATEKAAIKFANKMLELHGLVLTVENNGGVWMVVSD